MKYTLLFIVALLVAAASCREEGEYKEKFANWVQKHSKTYTSDEFSKRYSAFKDNLDYVEKWNSENQDTILGMNGLADLTNAEYQEKYLGVKFDYHADKAKVKNYDSSLLEVTDIPTSIDWRTTGAVTEVKNQGQCGSCWSFSTTGSIEGAWKIAGNKLVALSEQNLMDCSTSYGNEGCNGGLMDQAFQYVIKNAGVDTEASYPYKGADGTCAYKESDKGATISSYADIPAGNETALTAAIGTVGPVSVAIDASHASFQLYSSGVYYSFLCSTTRLDHGVLAVGYGTNGTHDYYIVKNSWGATWGQEGYLWMSRNRRNNCGIATSASYPKV